jgi:hypothetical protein
MGRISPIVVLPDSVDLNGPQSLILSLPDTLSLNLHAARVDNNFQEQVEVELRGQEFVKRSPPVVDVRFEVGEIINIVKSIPLVTDKFPWGVVAGRDSVTCAFRFPAKYQPQFDEAYLRGSIDVSTIAKGETVTLLPELMGVPVFAAVTRVDSVRVKRY